MSQSTKLKDIANSLNLSIATISRALNNKSDISIKTKRLVLEEAKRLNYKPNRFTNSPKQNKETNVIGVILPIVNHFFFSSVLDGIMEKAHLYNHLVLVGESLQSASKEKKIIEDFIDYGISGLLIAPAQDSQFETNLGPVIHRRIPTIVIDRTYENFQGNYVVSDDYNGAYKAVSHLINNGYQRIAHIGSDDKHSIGIDRRNGYRDALLKHKLTLNKDYEKRIQVNTTEVAIENGYQACRNFFSLRKPPDAIFAVIDDVALGIYRFAKEMNLKIGKDLGVVGFSDSNFSKYVEPKLTTVKQNGKEMGSKSFEFYYAAMKTNGQLFQKTYDSTLIVRESSSRPVIRSVFD